MAGFSCSNDIHAFELEDTIILPALQFYDVCFSLLNVERSRSEVERRTRNREPGFDSSLVPF